MVAAGGWDAIPIQALPRGPAAVRRQVEVLLDGGIRQGGVLSSGSGWARGNDCRACGAWPPTAKPGSKYARHPARWYRLALMGLGMPLSMTSAQPTSSFPPEVSSATWVCPPKAGRFSRMLSWSPLGLASITTEMLARRNDVLEILLRAWQPWRGRMCGR